MANNDFSEQLLQTIDMLVEQRVGEIHFDETIPCKIVSIVDEEAGLYEVQYNSIIYKAYAKADETYRVGDQVYVNIPGGDYSSQVKLIIGKYTSAKEEALEYIDPFARAVFHKDIALPISGSAGLSFSKNSAVEQVSHIFKQLQETSLAGYDIMGLELGLDINTSNDWAIQVILKDDNGKVLYGVGDDDNAVSPYVFTKKEVAGNPNKLFPTMLQKKVFSLPSSLQLSKISSIELKPKGIEGSKIVSCKLYFGYSAKRFLDSPIHVYVEGNYNGSFTYDKKGHINVPNSTTPATRIELQALLIDQETETVLPVVPDGYQVRWYKYQVQAPGDSLGGGYWQFLGSDGPGVAPSYTIVTDSPKDKEEEKEEENENINNPENNEPGTGSETEEQPATAQTDTENENNTNGEETPPEDGTIGDDKEDSTENEEPLKKDTVMNTKALSTQFKAVLCKELAQSQIELMVIDKYYDDTWLGNSNNQGQYIQQVQADGTSKFYDYSSNKEINVETIDDLVKEAYPPQPGDNSVKPLIVAVVEIENDLNLSQIRYYERDKIGEDAYRWSSDLTYSMDEALLSAVATSNIFTFYNARNENSYIPTGNLISIGVADSQNIEAYTVLGHLIKGMQPEVYVTYMGDIEEPHKLTCELNKFGGENKGLITGFKVEYLDKEGNIVNKATIESSSSETPLKLTWNTEFEKVNYTKFKITCLLLETYDAERRDGIYNDLFFYIDDTYVEHQFLSFAQQTAAQGYFTIKQDSPADTIMYGVDQIHLRKDRDNAIKLQAVPEGNNSVNFEGAKWYFNEDSQIYIDSEDENSTTYSGDTCTIVLKEEYDPNGGDNVWVRCVTNDGFEAEYNFTLGRLPKGGLAESDKAYSLSPNDDYMPLYNATTKQLFDGAQKTYTIKLAGLTNSLKDIKQTKWSITSPNGQIVEKEENEQTPPENETEYTFELAPTFQDYDHPQNIVTCVIDNAYVVQAVFTFGLSKSDGTIYLDAETPVLYAYSEITNQLLDNTQLTVWVKPMTTDAWPGWSNTEATDKLEITWTFPQENSLILTPVMEEQETLNEDGTLTRTISSKPFDKAYSCVFNLQDYWDADLAAALNNKISCSVNGHPASINFSFARFESNDDFEIIYPDDNNHFPVYVRSVTTTEDNKEITNFSLATWHQAFNLSIIGGKQEWWGKTHTFEWKSDADGLIRFKTGSDKEGWEVSSTAITNTGNILCTFADTASPEHLNGSSQKLTCTIDNRYQATLSFTFGEINSTGAFTLDTVDQTIAAYDPDINYVEDWATPVPISIELQAGLSKEDITSIEWMAEPLGEFITGFSFYEDDQSPSETLTWPSTEWNLESPPMTVYMYLNPKWVNTTNVQKVKCRINNTDNYMASMNFSFGKISKAELITLTPSRDAISAYNLNGNCLPEFQNGIEVRLKTLFGKTLPPGDHTIDIKYTNNIIGDLTVIDDLNNVTADESDDTDGRYTVTIEEGNDLNISLTFLLKDSLTNVTSFTDKIDVLVDEQYHASSELTFLKIDTSQNKFRIDADEYYAPYGLYSKKLVSDADKKITLRLVDLANNPLAVNNNDVPMIDDIEINSISWTLVDTNSNIAAWGETESGEDITTITGLDTTIEVNLNEDYVADFNGVLFTSISCTITTVTGDEYTATIPLPFEYADPNNLDLSLLGDPHVFNLINKIPPAAKLKNPPKLVLTRLDDKELYTDQIQWEVRGEDNNYKIFKKDIWDLTSHPNNSKPIIEGIIDFVTENPTTKRIFELICTVDGAYRAIKTIELKDIPSEGVFSITPQKNDIPAYGISSNKVLNWWKDKPITLKTVLPSEWSVATPDIDNVIWEIITPEDKYHQITLNEGSNSEESQWSLMDEYKGEEKTFDENSNTSTSTPSGRQEHVIQCTIDDLYKATAILDFSLVNGSGIFYLDASEYDWEYSAETQAGMPYNTSWVEITPKLFDQTIASYVTTSAKTWAVYKKSDSDMTNPISNALLIKNSDGKYVYANETAGLNSIQLDLSQLDREAYIVRCVDGTDLSNLGCYAEIQIQPSRILTSNIAEITTSTGETTLPFFDQNEDVLPWLPSIELTMKPKSGEWPESQEPDEYDWSVTTSHSNTWTLSGDNPSTMVLTPTKRAWLEEVVVTCVVDCVYSASITLTPTILDKSKDLKIVPSDGPYIICYLPDDDNSELDEDSRVAKNGITFQAQMPSGWPDSNKKEPHVIEWEIPQTDTLLKTLLEPDEGSSDSSKKSDSTDIYKITITPDDFDQIPTSIVCKVATDFDQRYADNFHNQIICRVDGVAIATYGLSFGLGDVTGNFFYLEAEKNPSSTPVYDANDDALQETFRITVLPFTSDIRNKWAGKTIKYTYRHSGCFVAGWSTGLDDIYEIEESGNYTTLSRTISNKEDIVVLDLPIEKKRPTGTEEERCDFKHNTIHIEIDGFPNGGASAAFFFAKLGKDYNLLLRCVEGPYVVAYDKGEVVKGKDTVTFELTSANDWWPPSGEVNEIKWEVLSAANGSTCLLESFIGDDNKDNNPNVHIIYPTETMNNAYRIECTLAEDFKTSQSNLIRCTINNNSNYSVIASVNFGQLTQGTSFAFSIVDKGDGYFNNTAGSEIQVQAQLWYTDSQGVQIDQTGDVDVTWSWHSGQNYYDDATEEYISHISFSDRVTRNSIQTLTLDTPFDTYASGVEGVYYNNYILKATCKVQALYNNGENTTKEVTLAAYYPIKVSTGFTPQEVNGVFELLWNSDGKLLNTNASDIQYQPHDGPGDSHWQILYSGKQDTSEYWISQDGYLQYWDDKDDTESWQFSNPVVPCVYYENGWQQPLFMHVSCHDVDLSNQWSGSSVTIDNVKHTVMATAMGAGEKHSDNTFTGVLMGKFLKGNNGDIVNGLYGFNNGQTTFRIDATTGNAYFKGHIEALSGDIGGWTIAPFDNESDMDTYKTGLYTQRWLDTNKTKYIQFGLKNSTTATNFAIYCVRFNKDGTKDGDDANIFGIQHDGTALFSRVYINNRFNTENMSITGTTGVRVPIASFQSSLILGSAAQGPTEIVTWFDNYDIDDSDNTKNYNERAFYGYVLQNKAQYDWSTTASDEITGKLYVGYSIPKIEYVVGSTTYSGYGWYADSNAYNLKGHQFNIMATNVSNGLCISCINKTAKHLVPNSTSSAATTLSYSEEIAPARITLFAGPWRTEDANGARIILESYVDSDGNVQKNSSIRLRTYTYKNKHAMIDKANIQDDDRDNLIIRGSTGRLNGTWYVGPSGSVAVTSDRSKKYDICSLLNSYNNLFDLLRPIRYKYNNGTSDRYHTGFIAQEVEQAIKDAGLTNKDFAALVIDEETGTYYLRYEEFIALCVSEIQKLKTELKELKEKKE